MTTESEQGYYDKTIYLLRLNDAIYKKQCKLSTMDSLKTSKTDGQPTRKGGKSDIVGDMVAKRESILEEIKELQQERVQYISDVKIALWCSRKERGRSEQATITAHVVICDLIINNMSIEYCIEIHNKRRKWIIEQLRSIMKRMQELERAGELQRKIEFMKLHGLDAVV